MVIIDFYMTSNRYGIVNMPFPWAQRPLYFLIPNSDARANFDAVYKPFQIPVNFTNALKKKNRIKFPGS